MQTLKYVSPTREEITLTDLPFGVVDWKGLSSVDMDVQSQQVPFSDGAVFLDALLAEREIEITVAVCDGNDLGLRYELKRELISALNPKLGEGYLVYTNDYLSKRIKCVPHVPEFENKNADDSGSLKAMLTFTACTPYWEDITETYVTFNMDKQPVIVNNGDVPCGVNIEIAGFGAKNPVIKNVTMDDKIAYSGTVDGNLSISTQFGEKTVEEDSLHFDLLSGYSMRAVTEGNGLIVRVGDSILTSENGVDWTSRTADVFYELYGVRYLNGCFFAVGIYDLILRSEDGITWTKVNIGTISGLSPSYIYDIAYDEDNGIYVAGTYTSTDGITWTNGNAGTGLVVLYISDLHMLVSISGKDIRTSTDGGTTWTTRYTGSYAPDSAYMIYDGTTIFATGGGFGVVTSTDGITWTQVLSGLLPYGIAYSAERGIYVLSKYNSVEKSTDGITWTPVTSTGTVGGDLIYSSDNGLFITESAISPNLTEWEEVEMCISGSPNLRDIVYNESLDRFVAVGTNIVTSTDGKNWETVFEGDSWIDFYAVIYTDEFGFVAIGKKLAVSEDGEHWTQINCPWLTNYTGYGIAWNRNLNLFVAVGNSGSIYTSPDLETWTQRTSPLSGNYTDVIWCEDLNLFVAVAESVYQPPLIATSTDGITWAQVATGIVTETYLLSVTWSRELSRFVAVGYKDDGGNATVGAVLTSTDGSTWEEHDCDSAISLSDVIYCDAGYFIAVGEGIEISPDGENWTAIESPTSNASGGVAYGKLQNLFVVAYASKILTSYYGGKTNKIENISPDSNMGFNLHVGGNLLRYISDNSKGSVLIKYRQKYLGV